ncbi:hypothetical protein FACS1894139_16800 [Planctomycetales bacterium]|nr:hypothetical protein FACS1894107_12660 [Planctomycetales bacterium]GHS98756.1 hypothetical protein FACS1894108_07500 [Planctomycetales bacterium]GHT07857.1 hypothetical protein FACS1894139_16800 [Planctomycetales bacterium]
MSATMASAHAEIPPVNFTPATERRSARPANAELTAAEIEAFVQAVEVCKAA